MKRPDGLPPVALALAAGLAAALIGGALFVELGSSEHCAPVEVRLGEVVHGPRGWSGLVLYEQYEHAGACLHETTLALYAPGESWEAEALRPRTVLLVSEEHLDESQRADAAVSWEPDALRVAALLPRLALIVIDAQRMSTSERQGAFFRCEAPPVDPGRFAWSDVPRASSACREITDAR